MAHSDRESYKGEKSCCQEQHETHVSSCCSSSSVSLQKHHTHSSCCTSEPSESINLENPGQIETYRVYGMDCPSCAATIEKSLRNLHDIQEINLNYSTGKLQVTAAHSSAFSPIIRQVEKLGFDIEPIHPQSSKTYLIEGMDCAACANTIVNHLKNVSGVQDVRVNFSTGKAQVDHDVPADEIIREIAKAGYTATLITNSRTVSSSQKTNTLPVIASGALIALGFTGSFFGLPALMSNVLYAIAMIISGYKPAKSAYYGIKSRSLDMNVLMTVAALGAAIIGEWLEGATVVWLFALGVMLQTRSIEQTRNSIRNLMNLAPPDAWVKTGNTLIKKAVEDVALGDVLVVKPGDRIPLDGEIIQGDSSINQAPITGESIPVDKTVGDTVYAGTINENGSLEIKVTKLVKDTTISKIIHLVEEAQEKKAPTQAFIDKFAAIYTPIVFILALFVMVLPPLVDGLWGEWFYKGLELLVVACPCALVISTPVAIVSAIGNAAKNGVLIKGGTFLEKAGAINAIAFDKTGTLTEGKPAVSDVIALKSEQDLLAVIKTLEAYSNHPIAKAIVAYADERNVDTLDGANFRSITGKGVQATINGTNYYAGNKKLFIELGTDFEDLQTHVERFEESGKTIIIVGTEKELLGVISVADTIRSTTVSALQNLKNTSIKQTVMLTGDHEGTAKTIAKEAGVERYFANLLPEDKVKAIQKLQAEGYKTAMVGDGINDAPALATADLGIAMGGAGTDTAMETADIVLMADNLEKLPHTIKLSRKALKIIKQNIWFSIIIKAIALIFIFPGWLTLWIAVLSDTGAALLVILNSLRLLKMKE